MDIFEHLFGQHGHEHPEARSSDPSQYPRAVRITDDEMKMAITKMDLNTEQQAALNRKLSELMDELNIARAERVVVETKFWREMREKFPLIVIDRQCGMGLRKWDGEYWLVSWGGDEVHNQPQGGQGLSE